MKVSPLIMFGGIAVVGLGMAMVVTNPDSLAYEGYAQEQLSLYLKENVCTQPREGLGQLFQRPCASLVDAARSQIRQVIIETTVKDNYFLFSIYRTNLDMKPFLPAYEVETIGILANFYTYKVQEY